MIEGLKAVVKGSELKELFRTKIGWNADQLLKVSQRKIMIAGGGDTAAAEAQLERDTRQLKFWEAHVLPDEDYHLNAEELAAIGVGLDMGKTTVQLN